NEHTLAPIPVSVNLLSLMLDICLGYRPNKHDKNSIVLLDELVVKITRMASLSKVLFLYSGDERLKLKENSDNEIRVSGL
ncbi:DNA phosphorothioation-dependent restriction protein DptF, partial [Oleiphilus sp. HI0123]